MEITKEKLLEDTKIEMKDTIDRERKSKSSFHLLMKSYVFFEKNAFPEYEKQDYAKQIYEELKWNTAYHDVINSFWTTFSFAMHAKCPKEYPIAPLGNVKIYKHHNKKYNLDSFPEKYCDEDNSTTKNVSKLDLRWINTFPALCHCVANFMPCPPDPYNALKGCLKDVKDYFPLMIDKIQQCIDEEKAIECKINGKENKAEIEKLKEWQKWFIENQEKYFLSGYYKINVDQEGKQRLKGIPLFDGQSLNHPTPESQKEVDDCLNEILDRIFNRAALIVDKQKKTECC